VFVPAKTLPPLSKKHVVDHHSAKARAWFNPNPQQGEPHQIQYYGIEECCGNRVDPTVVSPAAILQ
jgi:hypothetical protein